MVSPLTVLITQTFLVGHSGNFERSPPTSTVFRFNNWKLSVHYIRIVCSGVFLIWFLELPLLEIYYAVLKNILHIFMTSKGVICSYFAKYFNCCICRYKHHIRCAKG